MLPSLVVSVSISWGQTNTQMGFCCSRQPENYHATSYSRLIFIHLSARWASSLLIPTPFHPRPHRRLLSTKWQSALLVPYFSWQRSHALHHANTNHMEDGETHVPELMSHTGFGLWQQRQLLRRVLGNKIGTSIFGVISIFSHLVVSSGRSFEALLF